MSGAAPPDRAPELLRRVRTLELAARRNAAGPLSGDYLTSIRGRGLVFHESRKYVPGDPARTIDWNITARLGEPYVKVNLEERQRDLFIALDVSPSLHTGFQNRTKLEYAVELAATLGVSALESGDRVGWVIFADRALAVERPRGGRRQLFRFLRALLEHAEPWSRPVAVSDPRAAIHAVQRHRGRFVLFLISDFIDHDVPDDLKYLQARHDVSLLHVYDPLEYAERGPLRFSAFAPEAGGRAAPTRLGAGGTLEEMRSFLRRRAAAQRIAVGSFSTASAVRHELAGFFHSKRRLLVR